MQYAEPTKLRAYFFGNHYISPIQHGIQSGHVVTKLFAKYGRAHEGERAIAADILYDWADVGVTKILLNGGYQSNLEVVYEILEKVCPVLGLPFQKFHEEQASLNGALTSVGVVAPEEVYDLYKDVSSLEVAMDTMNGRDALFLLNALCMGEAANSTVNEKQAIRFLYHTLKSSRLA